MLLNFSIISGFNHGHFDFVETEGHLIYIPNENYFGVDSLRYIVTDNGLTGNQSEPLSDTALVIINVLPVNDSPIIGSISDTVMNEDSFIQIPIDVTDVDDDSLSLISFSNDSSYISVINEDGYLNIMSNLNWNGSTIVTVIINDNIGRAIDIEEFQLTVEPVNDLPEFENNLNVGYAEYMYTYSTSSSGHYYINLKFIDESYVNNTYARPRLYLYNSSTYNNNATNRQNTNQSANSSSSNIGQIGITNVANQYGTFQIVAEPMHWKP